MPPGAYALLRCGGLSGGACRVQLLRGSGRVKVGTSRYGAIPPAEPASLRVGREGPSLPGGRAIYMAWWNDSVRCARPCASLPPLRGMRAPGPTCKIAAGRGSPLPRGLRGLVERFSSMRPVAWWLQSMHLPSPAAGSWRGRGLLNARCCLGGGHTQVYPGRPHGLTKKIRARLVGGTWFRTRPTVDRASSASVQRGLSMYPLRGLRRWWQVVHRLSRPGRTRFSTWPEGRESGGPKTHR